MFGFIRRAILNNLLENKANALKARYDNFENEMREEVGTIVEKTTRENTKKIKSLVNDLNLKLEGDQEFFREVENPLKEYIRLSFEVNLVYERLKLFKSKKKEVLSRVNFLKLDSDQTYKEIEELEAIRTKLLSIADIQQYFSLLKYNGIKLEGTNNLEYLSQIKQIINDKNTLEDERFALKKLEKIIRERLFINKDIRFLEWAIKEKNKHIIINKIERKKCFTIVDIIKNIINNILNNINEIEDNRFRIASDIKEIIKLKPKRMVKQWNKLISDKDAFFTEINELNSQLSNIYSIDESNRTDNDWDRMKSLLRDKTDLKENSNVDSINIEINKLRENHREQVERRWKIIHELLQKYELKLLTKPKEPYLLTRNNNES
jgi:hypothetical protein